MKAEYTRLYADSEGESHFEDIEVELASVDLVPFSPPLAVSEAISARSVSFFGGVSGWSADWHPSAARNLFVVISGEWEIQASDGTTRSFSPRSVLLVEDTIGRGHKSRVVSQEDSLALLIQLVD